MCLKYFFKNLNKILNHDLIYENNNNIILINLIYF